MVSFNILIASIGRPSLQRIVTSIVSQLHACDHLTIVFDDVDIPTLNTEGAQCQIHLIRQTPNLGCWGHSIRNKYARKLEKTDFVMHADDDDVYVEGAFDELRKLCVNTETLYIAKILNCFNDKMPPGNYLRVGYINTACGIIPYDLNKKGIWLMTYAGDGAFYEQLDSIAKNVEYLDTVIYKFRDV
jgi:hypothetical protein